MVYDISRFKERIANSVLLQRASGDNEYTPGILLRPDGTCDMWRFEYGHACNELFIFVEDLLRYETPFGVARDIEDWNRLIKVMSQYVPDTIEVIGGTIAFY